MKRSFLAAIVVAVTVAGCATVPPESVELSIELTKMIRSAEASHLATLHLFIEERKQRADDFLKATWTPRFMDHAMLDSGIMDSLKRAGSESARSQLMKEFSEDAASVISGQRAAVFGAIEQIGRMLEDSVRAHYADMLTASQALTAHINSVAEVTETRQQILGTLRVDPGTIIPLDKVNGVLEKLLTYQGTAEKVASYVEQAREILKGK